MLKACQAALQRHLASPNQTHLHQAVLLGLFEICQFPILRHKEAQKALALWWIEIILKKGSATKSF